jgi:queuine tRNA-ribosyltransferase
MRPTSSFVPSPPGTSARLGQVHLGHTSVQTPQFMPVGTRAAVRAQRTADLEAAGATMLLANTWHLVQRPGTELLERFGGIRRFMGWKGGILTDSGGYQAFSLAAHARVDDHGIALRDPKSSRDLYLSPESVVAAQRSIGSDIAMVLDHCVPSTSTVEVSREAMERTHRWAAASLAARGDAPMGLFGIVQGACHPALRRESARVLAELEVGGHAFDGLAIGGLAVGETRSEREDMTAVVTAMLPTDRPRYLMGVGTPIDLLEAVHRGVDLFDCILPTAVAQNGRVYTSIGRLDLRRGAYRTDEAPLDPACACPTCLAHSRAYLHHLYRCEEPTAWTLLGLHNLHFWLALMGRVRGALAEGTFLAFYEEQRDILDRPDPEHPTTPPRPRPRPRPPESLGRWALHHAPAFGDRPAFVAIRDTVSGEVMHSVTAPDAEARTLYVEPPRLKDRAREFGEPFVVWDVGLGAGTNAIEVVRAWEESGGERALNLVSFEIDLDALRLAVANHDHFPRLRHSAPAGILARGAWARGNITWTLLEGDFRERMGEAPSPDAILYDPFSTKVDGPLWQPEVLAAVRRACADKACSLHTYSRATGVRAALLATGWFVGPGPATGPKEETTIAYTHATMGPLCGRAFLEKWERSSARWPGGVRVEEQGRLQQALFAHAQWGHVPAR